MADIIYALSQKRARLYERKRKVREEAEKQIREIDSEIQVVERAIQILNDAVSEYLCPACKGTGSTRRCDAAGQMEDVTCTRCHGTGVIV